MYPWFTNWLIIAIIVVMIIIFIARVNKMIILSNRIANLQAQIEVQLTKKTELISELVKTVKGYMKHEQYVFEKITNAIGKLYSASTLNERISANEEIEDALGVLGRVIIRYPELKANENFKLLQEEISNTENKIAYARQFYNDAVLEYNNTISTIPGNLLAKILRKTPKKYLEPEKKEVEIDFT